MQLGDFARYKPGGPHGSLSGALGIIEAILPESVYRVRFWGPGTLIDGALLEPPSYWAKAGGTWAGPFYQWRDAHNQLCYELEVAAASFTNLPALRAEYDQAIQQLQDTAPCLEGVTVYASDRRYQIALAGPDRPPYEPSKVLPKRTKVR